ncbi:MAG: hydroxymethylbilane synthase [Gammaproteobacteria bacterium]
MLLSKLKIISRESPLAMWQARHVSTGLRLQYPGLEVEIIAIKTRADRFLDTSLESLGGKGVFVKELEQALLDKKADLAVHSMKDVTIDLPDALSLPVVLKREDVRDAFVSNQFQRLEDLPEKARVGTSSLRRQCQLRALRPDLEITDIRGNIGTRLKKLDEGQYDALILAAAGIKRLGLGDRVGTYLEPGRIVPAIGQGALGIEIRGGDNGVLEMIRFLDDEHTHMCVSAERALSRRLNGGCHVPIAAHAEIDAAQLSMIALVGRVDGSEIICSAINGPAVQAGNLGKRLGAELLDKGAGTILQEITGGTSE